MQNSDPSLQQVIPFNSCNRREGGREHASNCGPATLPALQRPRLEL